MSQIIKIQIQNKVATPISTVPIVCGNADYKIEFEFDEEWEKYEVKTGTFLVRDKTIKQVFTGNVCDVPVLQNTLLVEVGVFAGTIDDGTLSTSTPALVGCRRSVTDWVEEGEPPEDDVYNQIVGLCDEAVKTAKKTEEKTDELEKRIAESVSVEIVQKTGESETKVMSQKAVTDVLNSMEDYVEEQIGDIDTALDSIIEIQNGLLGGATE
jgi:hypothetical protein